MDRHNFRSAHMIVAGLGMLLLIACEGGRIDGATTTSSRAVGLLPVEDGRGIQAVVGGEHHAYRGDMRVTVAGGDTRNLQVVSQARDADFWAIHGLESGPGNYRCASGGLQIMLQRAGQPTLSTTPGGGCEITLAQADSRRIEGTFSGLLLSPDGQQHTLQNGAFRFELAHVIPDTDADGIADADDNCPFDANPDQADGNANGLGTACDTTEEES